jgi:transmembrane sensor
MMTNNRPDWERLARYVAGECSEQEAAELESWAARDDAHRSLLESLQWTWRAAEWPRGHWEVEGALSRVKSGSTGTFTDRPRIRERAAASVAERKHPRFGWARVLALAAVLAAVSVLGSQYFRRDVVPPTPVAVQELVTEKGQRARIRLADGTQVVLGPGSRLETLQNFGAAAREVRLSGEAYFDVPGDPERPFRVYVGSAVTQVLGTQFGIRAYPDDPAVSVVVAEGRVSLRSKDAEGDAAVLEAGMLGELARDGAEVIARPVDPDAQLGWRDGRLTFENAPLSAVARDLERWYDTPVRVGDDTLGSLRLTASFRNQPVEVVLEIVARSLDVDWKRIGDTYVFVPKKTARLVTQ